MSVSIDLLYHIDKNLLEKMTNAISFCIMQLLPELKINVGLIICDNEYIKNLNKKYRNKDSITDVLSFPLLDNTSAGNIVFTNLDIDPKTDEIMLGDIIISFERAQAQAQEFEHSLEREMSYLAIHSMLHLVGYRHENENDKKIMRDIEKSILSQIGVISLEHSNE